MRALLLSTDAEPLDAVDAALRSSGYDVVRCHPDVGPGFPCTGLRDGGTCPLDDAPGVDVAVDVRQHPWPNPTLRETGVTCALRAKVPVVIVTDHVHPFEHLGVSSVATHADLVDACDEAIADALEPLRAAVVDEVRGVLARHDLADEPFEVGVDRRDGRLHLCIAVSVPKPVGAMAATRAAVVARRFDDHAERLSIEVVPAA
jgi:hypothetical protein